MTIKTDFVCNLSLDSNQIRLFYAENWDRGIALTDKKFYDWQFLETPNGKKKDHCVVAYDEQKKEVLGVMGLNKRKFFLDGKSINGAELTTWIVSDKATRSGVGAKILGFIQSNFDILIGMGITNMALPIYMRSGFRFMQNIPRFIRVINFEKIKEYSTFNNLAIKLIKKWSSLSLTKYIASEVNDENYKELFNSIKTNLNLFSRDNNNRKWRYGKHPYFKYKEYIISDLKASPKSSSYVALREELNLREFKILHVMDLFGNTKSLPLALSFIEMYAIDKGFDLIDFYCTTSSIYRFMLCSGWFSTTDDLCFQFPHLFHPIEMRNPPTTSLIYWSKNNLISMADLSKLYISKQDADLDRPTLKTINAIKDLSN